MKCQSYRFLRGSDFLLRIEAISHIEAAIQRSSNETYIRQHVWDSPRQSILRGGIKPIKIQL